MAKPPDFDPFGWEEGDDDDNTAFYPEDFNNEITSFNQLWEFADYDDYDYEVYEFHGTGDT